MSKKPIGHVNHEPTPFELAMVATMLMGQRGTRTPHFTEASIILKQSAWYLSGATWLDKHFDHTEVCRELDDEDEDLFVEELKAACPSMNDLEEPKEYPATYASCLRLITGERDRKRRLPWLKAAALPEELPNKLSRIDYWLAASQLHANRPPRKKSASRSRDPETKQFVESAVVRDEKGQVKKIKKERRRDDGTIVGKSEKS